MSVVENAAEGSAESVRPTAADRQNSASTSSSAPGRAELFLTVFVAGLAVIVIEILGTRIIGPVFGVSLFVWSALLMVTLGSLATGYYAGGILIDRAPSGRILGFVVAAAGVLLAMVAALSQPLLGFCENLGPRGGPLVSATLLFAPSLIALGMVGPIAVRLATSNVSATGHRVGAIYAISTAGSLVGTALTAFFFIPNFETREILLAAAALLTLAGAIPLALRWRRAAFLSLLVPILASGQEDPPLPKGIKVLDRSNSIYGLVEVIDDANRGVRLLRSDHSIIGAQLVGDRSGAFSFLHLLEAVRFARPEARKLLQVGLGTGSLGAALGANGVDVDVVEIDPSVVEFAKKYFGFSTRGEIHVEDARTYLRRSDRRYDVIVHDTFTGGTTPEHLLSVEVIRRIHDLLTPGGVVVLNFPGYDHGENAAGTWAVARTLRAVFQNMRVFRDAPPDEEPESPTNIVFFASDGDLEFRIPANAAFENPTCEQIQRSFQSWEIRAKVPEGPVISDERNPMAALQLPAAEAHFAEMNKLLPREVWLR